MLIFYSHTRIPGTSYSSSISQSKLTSPSSGTRNPATQPRNPRWLMCSMVDAANVTMTRQISSPSKKRYSSSYLLRLPQFVHRFAHKKAKRFSFHLFLVAFSILFSPLYSRDNETAKTKSNASRYHSTTRTTPALVAVFFFVAQHYARYTVGIQ